MPDAIQHDRVNMTEAEWQARCDLAALYRITDHLGWTDTIDTHMTVRIPGEPNAFLINNYGDLFHEINASSLVKMDLDGNVHGKDGRFNAAGFTIHSGVYKARPDANCVMHTHTRAGTGISVLRKLGRAAQSRSAFGRQLHPGSAAAPLHAGARLRGRDHRPRPRRAAGTDRGRHHRARRRAHEGAARVAGIWRDLLECFEARYRPEGHRLPELAAGAESP